VEGGGDKFPHSHVQQTDHKIESLSLVYRMYLRKTGQEIASAPPPPPLRVQMKLDKADLSCIKHISIAEQVKT
jgi:hypothetical protein